MADQGQKKPGENELAVPAPTFDVPEWEELRPQVEEQIRARLRAEPQADLAETELIQVAMLLPDVMRVVADILKPEHFLKVSRRRVYRAMLTLYRDGRTIEPIALADVIERVEALPRMDALMLVNEFIGVGVVIPQLAERPDVWLSWCEQIIVAAAKRFLLAAAYSAQADAKDGERQLDEIIRDLRTSLVQIENVGLRKKSVALVEMLDSPEVTSGAPGKVVATGFNELDRLLRGGGLEVGTLTFIGARTSRGKSTLAFQIAANVAERGLVVAFFAFEMKRQSVVRRMLTIRAELPYSSVQRGLYEADELERMRAELRQMTRWRMEICDNRRMTWADIQRECRAIKQANDGQLDLVVVDYLELVSLERQYGTRAEELSAITRDAKLFAGEPDVDCPVMIPAQIKRAALAGEKFGLEAFRGSGSVEQDADVALIIQEPDEELPESYDVELTLAKQREGSVGSVRLTFDRAFGGFREQMGSAVFGLTGSTQSGRRRQRRRRQDDNRRDRDWMSDGDDREEF